MNQVLKVFIVIAGCVFLSSCGGQDEEAATPATPAAEAVEASKAYNPLAREQQLIRDAQSIQGILDKDAEEKKKALENIN